MFCSEIALVGATAGTEGTRVLCAVPESSISGQQCRLAAVLSTSHRVGDHVLFVVQVLPGSSDATLKCHRSRSVPLASSAGCSFSVAVP